LQTTFYMSLSLSIGALDTWRGVPRSLDQVFHYSALYSREMGGARLLLAYIATALAT